MFTYATNIYPKIVNIMLFLFVIRQDHFSKRRLLPQIKEESGVGEELSSEIEEARISAENTDPI